MLPRGAALRRMVREPHDTVTLELEPVASDDPVAFRPGQFNMLYAFGVGEVPISVSGDPTAEGPWVHTVRAVGPVSRALSGLKRGAVVGIRGPFGSAWPVEEADGHDTVDRAGAGWRGQVGVVTQLLRQAVFEPEDALVFVCGPEIMMRFTCQELETRGVPRERIYLSAERNMKCAIGQCGHCQLGPKFLCKDGPVLPLPVVSPLLHVREL